MAKILIIGCGDIGAKLAAVLVEKNHLVTGIKRKPPENNDESWQYFFADIAVKKELAGLSTDFDQVFFIVSPGQRDELSYRRVYRTGLTNMIEHFKNIERQPHWIFVSSTSVYQQSQGEWVDETSLAQPVAKTAKLIREAEQTLLTRIPGSTVVRFSGIYGPNRKRLIEQAKTIPVIQKTPPYYTNRIHVEDCVGVLVFLLQQRLKGVLLENCYLATDSEPASHYDVINWIAQKIQINSPIIKPQTDIADMNKRCRNTRLKALGYQFEFPSYKEGYLNILEN